MTSKRNALYGRYIDAPQFEERHETRIYAAPAAILDAVEAISWADDPVTRGLLWLRALPAQAQRSFGRGEANASRVRNLDLSDFTALGRDGDRALAYGLMGRFWRPDGALLAVTDEDFRKPAPDGMAKLVWTFWVEPDGRAQKLVTVTGVECTGPEALRAMRPYWLVIRPFSGLIRRRILNAVRRTAEGTALQVA